ncbi:TPA: hypothetical protein DCL30_04425 [Candidatus Peribacteria bacterium]|nr:MAG: hypothetical protein A3J91_02205 [Candidatus Peribacteria bacterium RIFOXYC2_FULL_58_10]OGJ84024.1 MAG: hypothetical protein A2529_04480 [Candidatus Peribacteria bacterium RIFOXYD2_FULL_58_15]HAI98752.1 hypothetical protein [Candidatus Peribacteria bacterium]HAS34128.1 hypothetical protein [Candidatus Peribacteria bacterium]
MDPNRRLAVFIMGGTIDSRNDPSLDGEAVPLEESLVKRYLESLRLSFKVSIHQICLKDSRAVSDEDQARLISMIEGTGEMHNMVTYGTYKMDSAARLLVAQRSLRDRVIMLTGSMGTILGTVDRTGRLSPSDAQFNLGYAAGEVFRKQPGVYIAMNGDTFRYPDEYWKHDETGVHWGKTDTEPSP